MPALPAPSAIPHIAPPFPPAALRALPGINQVPNSPARFGSELRICSCTPRKRATADAVDQQVGAAREFSPLGTTGGELCVLENRRRECVSFGLKVGRSGVMWGTAEEEVPRQGFGRSFWA